jgi:hypothetical protein
MSEKNFFGLRGSRGPKKFFLGSEGPEGPKNFFGSRVQHHFFWVSRVSWLAQGSKKFFLDSPMPPYKKGLGTRERGDIYVCKAILYA